VHELHARLHVVCIGLMSSDKLLDRRYTLSPLHPYPLTFMAINVVMLEALVSSRVLQQF
jgi:hypothetical protein